MHRFRVLYTSDIRPPSPTPYLPSYSSEANLCPLESRIPLDASELPICKDKEAFERATSSDIRFAQAVSGSGGASGVNLLGARSRNSENGTRAVENDTSPASGGGGSTAARDSREAGNDSGAVEATENARGGGSGGASGGGGGGVGRGDGGGGNCGVGDDRGATAKNSGGDGDDSGAVEARKKARGGGGTATRRRRRRETVAGAPFRVETAEDPGCGQALWQQLSLSHIG